MVASGTVTAIREEDGVRLADCDVSLAREGESPCLEGTATVALPGD